METGKETWLWKIPGVGLPLSPLLLIFDLLGRRLVKEEHDASLESFTEAPRLPMPHCGSGSLIQDSKKSHEHPCLQPGAGFPCRLHCSSFTLSLPSRALQDRAGGSPTGRCLLRVGTPQPCTPYPPCRTLPAHCPQRAPCYQPPWTQAPVLSPKCLPDSFFLIILSFFPGLPMVPECRPLGYLHTRTPCLSKRGFQSPKTFFQNK